MLSNLIVAVILQHMYNKSSLHTKSCVNCVNYISIKLGISIKLAKERTVSGRSKYKHSMKLLSSIVLKHFIQPFPCTFFFDERVGWHHQLYGHESEQTLGYGDGQEAWHAAVHGVTKSRAQLSD